MFSGFGARPPSLRFGYKVEQKRIFRTANGMKFLAILLSFFLVLMGSMTVSFYTQNIQNFLLITNNYFKNSKNVSKIGKNASKVENEFSEFRPTRFAKQRSPAVYTALARAYTNPKNGILYF